MHDYGSSSRRTVLKALGGSSALLGLGAGTASALTDPEDAEFEKVFREATDGFGYGQWNSMRWRVYGTTMHDAGTVQDVCADVAEWCENVVSQSWQITEYKVAGKMTNIEPFRKELDKPRRRADEYVEAFGHDYYGGGNLWLEDDGGALDRPANGPTGPEPYRNRNVPDQANYPHAFKGTNKVDGVYRAAVHECAHLLSREQYWSDELDDTDNDHQLGTEKNGKATVFARPWSENSLGSGDCSGAVADATGHSIQVSDCAVTAFEDSTDGWENF